MAGAIPARPYPMSSTLAQTPSPVAAAISARGHLRRERQARVGILRNTNAPPKPPLRRAALTGKWPSLRSSRRAAPELIAGLTGKMTAQPAPEIARPTAQGTPIRVQTDPTGAVTGVDVDALARDAATPATASAPRQPVRAPFAAEYRGAADRAAQQEADRQPEILRPETWRDLASPAPAPACDPPTIRDAPAWPMRFRRLATRLIGRAGFLALSLSVALFLALLFLQLLAPVRL